MSDQFVHLHQHSEFSADGLRSIDKMIDIIAAKGFAASALTDHGSLAGAVSFYLGCKRQNIKPILGVEGYVEFDGEMGHITVIADGNDGWKSLVALQNKAHQQPIGKQLKPAFTIDQLIQHSNGLVVLSGCVASPFHRLPYTEAKSLGCRLKSVFGPKFFIEVMTVGDSPDLWERPLQLSQDIGAKLVLTNDVHFPLQEDAPIHTVLTRIKSAYDYSSEELWMKTRNELEARCKMLGVSFDYQDAMDRAVNIARLIQSPTLENKPMLPFIQDADKTLREMVANAIVTLDPSIRHQYSERAAYELDIICGMGFPTYFLILQDIVTYAKSVHVRVGSGRGSASGCLILYLLGITEIDPIKYNLSFDRFLNKHRVGMPDVDIDFDSERRQLVLDYAHKRWGAFPVATYGKWQHASLVHDLSSYFHLDRDLEVKAADEGVGSQAFTDLVARDPLIKQSYDAMLGQTKFRGLHAGGVVIVDDTLPLPFERTKDRDLAVAFTHGESDELGKIGAVKFDLLGLSALSVIRRLEERFKVEAPKDIPDGDKTFDIFKTGDLSGIFQFDGSDGIRRMTIEHQPNSLEELSAINALYRPGALDAGTAQHYLDYKQNPRKLHPLVDPILAPTYGVIVFQEQLQAVFAAVIGVTPAEGDLARRVILKSRPGDPIWEQEVADLKSKLDEGGLKNGFSQKLLNSLWKEIITHARYCLDASTMMDDGRTIEEWYHNPPLITRSYDEEYSQLINNFVVKVLDTGIQEVFELKLENGRAVNASAGHRFLTQNGWKRLDRLAEDDLIKTTANFVTIKSIQSIGDRQTFDIMMAPPFHNYVLGNDVIVHNSFNKSHSVAYSKLALDMAWWKQHHPTGFYGEMLNIDASQSNKYIIAAVLAGIEVKPPRITTSTNQWEYDDQAKILYAPLNICKYVGDNGALAVMNARQQQPFVSLKDFRSRVAKRALTSRGVKGLIALNAFEGIPGVEADLCVTDALDLNRSQFEIQQEVLGFILPTKALMARINVEKSSGRIAGVIMSKTDKKSQRGYEFSSYRLAPDGFFWSKTDRDLELGKVVSVQTNSYSQAKSIEEIVL